jgi:hypothetical protein
MINKSYAAIRIRWRVLAALTVVIGWLSLFPSMPQAGPTRAACTTQQGRTLAANRDIRLFSTDDANGSPTVYVCKKPDGRNWPVRSRDAVSRKPFGVSESWGVAAAEGGAPQDLFIRDVVARAATTGRTNSCRIGEADRPGQLVRVDVVVVTDNGHIGWSGEEHIGYGEPVVGTCVNGSAEIIARGADLGSSSLKLEGRVLTWMEAGSTRSARL